MGYVSLQEGTSPGGVLRLLQYSLEEETNLGIIHCATVIGLAGVPPPVLLKTCVEQPSKPVNDGGNVCNRKVKKGTHSLCFMQRRE